MADEKRIVEIGGVKVEVDLRTATTVDTYKVGDQVQALVKEYDGRFHLCPGVIVGFANFKELPTIEIVYLDAAYGATTLKTLSYNAASKDCEIAPVSERGPAVFDRATVTEILAKNVETAQAVVLDAKRKLRFFEKWCGMFFGAKKGA